MTRQTRPSSMLRCGDEREESGGMSDFRQWRARRIRRRTRGRDANGATADAGFDGTLTLKGIVDVDDRVRVRPVRR